MDNQDQSQSIINHHHGLPEALSNRELIVLELAKSLIAQPLHAESPIEEIVDCALCGLLYMEYRMKTRKSYADDG